MAIASGSDPIEGAGLAGAASYAGMKINNPVVSAVAAEAIQKAPVIIDKMTNSGNEENSK